MMLGGAISCRFDAWRPKVATAAGIFEKIEPGNFGNFDIVKKQLFAGPESRKKFDPTFNPWRKKVRLRLRNFLRAIRS
jgi:hypothetical protein